MNTNDRVHIASILITIYDHKFTDYILLMKHFFFILYQNQYIPNWKSHLNGLIDVCFLEKYRWKVEMSFWMCLPQIQTHIYIHGNIYNQKKKSERRKKLDSHPFGDFVFFLSSHKSLLATVIPIQFWLFQKLASNSKKKIYAILMKLEKSAPPPEQRGSQWKTKM